MDAVCFDLDGTLFDDRQYVRAGLLAAADVVERETGVDLAAELLAAYFQDGFTERTFDRVLDEHGLSTDLVPELVTAYHANDAPLVPFPDAEPTLEMLQTAYDLAVVTGGTNGAAKLERLGVAHYFDTVVVAPARGWTKREPEPFEAVLSALAATPAETAVVGDRPAIDFVQPNRLGMRTVRVRRGRYASVAASAAAEPDHVVDSLGAVPEMFRREQGTESATTGADHWDR
mgnify:CR=1 FL=1